MAWQTSDEMARCLVGYIADNRAVQRALKGEFNAPVTLTKIEHIRQQMRARAERARKDAPVAEPGGDAEYKSYCRRMEHASKAFAQALRGAGAV